MEPSAQEREREKSYLYFFLPKCNMRGNICAYKKKTKEEEKSRENNRTTHCRTRGWWSIIVSLLLLFAISVISLVYFKRENKRGKY